MSSENLHEDPTKLSPLTIDKHRAIVSLMEELEAVDWYNQRQEATADPELKQILIHNRDEEKEHAMMVLEWIRRHDDVFAEMIGTYINSKGNIIQVEKTAAAEEQGGGANDDTLPTASIFKPTEMFPSVAASGKG